MSKGRLVLLSALVIFAVLASSTPVHAITNGTVDTVHTYAGAWIVLKSDGTYGWCSGSLVSPKVFLTAGHCVTERISEGIPLDRMWVSFATNILANRGSWRAVAGFMANPLYVDSPYVQSDPHDLGVVILAKAVKDIAPATLAPVGLLDSLMGTGKLQGVKFTLVGYGEDENSQFTGDRKAAQSEFDSLQSAWLFTASNSNLGNGGICNRDSGGPTLYSDGTAEYLVGSHTLILGNCGSGNNADYRVDTTESLAFIQGEISANR